MKSILVFVTFLWITSVYAGFEQVTPGARQAGMAKACTGIADDAWSVFFNPAGLAGIHSAECSFFYSPSPFGLRPLSLSAAVVAMPTGFGTYGAAVRSFGFSLYREVSGSLSGAWVLPEIFAGASVNLHTVSIRGYGSAGTIGIDAGILAQITESVRCGAMIRNINAPVLGSGDESLPQSFTAGIGWIPAGGILIGVDCVSESPFDMAGRIGCEWNPVKILNIRLGASDLPEEYCAGIGVRFYGARFDYSAGIHRDLGLTHSFSVSFR